MAGPGDVNSQNGINQAMDIARRVISGETSLAEGLSQFEKFLTQQTGLDSLLSKQPANSPATAQTANSYTVKPGDNLTKIAAAHGTTWQELARINGISNPDMIMPNQQLRMPTGAAASQTYSVRAGDTVSEIAQRNGTTVAAIAQANNLADPDKISVNQTLTIPGRTAAGVSAGAPQGQAPAPAGVNPAAPVAPAGAIANGQIDLNRFLDSSQGSRALGAVIIGNAEGTRTPSGATTRAYGGHIDPGNKVANVGSFSLQNAGGRGPDAADRTQLGRLAAQRPVYEASARRAGLDPNNATLATAYFDLYNQSPKAAGRFLDQMGRLGQTGISQESVTQLRVDSFINPATGTRYPGAAGGFVTIARDRLGREPSAAEIRDTVMGDQSRRQRAMVSAMDAQGVNRGEAQGGAAPAGRANDITPAGDARRTQSETLTRWPVDNPQLNRADKAREGDGAYGTRRSAGSHGGIDLVGREGSPIRAAGAGTVVNIQPNPSRTYGYQVVIDHGNGVFTQYAHLQRGSITVNPGDTVTAGQQIAGMGRTGNTPPTGDTHLHFEVRIGSPAPRAAGGRTVDPLQYLGQTR